MDDAALFDRMHSSLLASGRLITAGASDSRLIERDGLTAAFVPSAPERSVFNSVIYRSPAELTGRARRAGRRVRATPECEPGRSGFRSETRRWRRCSNARATASTPIRPRWCSSSTASKGRLSPDVEIDVDPDIADIARMNDVAYSYDGDFARVLGDLPREAANRYVAVLDGQPAAGC